jgi:hypothetical protein
MADDRIANRLDTIIALLKLAHQDTLTRVRNDLLKDDVSAAVLERTETDAGGAGALKKEIAKATGESERTVQRRLADLVAMGALAKEGARSNVSYRSTGLI